MSPGSVQKSQILCLIHFGKHRINPPSDFAILIGIGKLLNHLDMQLSGRQTGLRCDFLNFLEQVAFERDVYFHNFS